MHAGKMATKTKIVMVGSRLHVALEPGHGYASLLRTDPQYAPVGEVCLQLNVLSLQSSPLDQTSWTVSVQRYPHQQAYSITPQATCTA